MRPTTLARLTAALLTFVAALGGPTVALAHGLAHEHELAASAHAHIDAANAAGSTSAADDDETPHPGLHTGCVAKLASAIGLALRSTPIVVPTLTTVVTAYGRPPIDAWAAAPTCAAPPDQPRAPPVH